LSSISNGDDLHHETSLAEEPALTLDGPYPEVTDRVHKTSIGLHWRIAMADRLLVIGNHNYSSWSLRPWLVLKHLGLPFRLERIALEQPGTAAAIRRHSPAGRVPVLVEGDVTVWDSLAIIEHLAERRPGLWPADPVARGMARSVSAEMHSGFQALRNELPMNIRASGRKVTPSPDASVDVQRILAIWTAARERFGTSGPWLFGSFSAADAMFTPVASRFRTYGTEVPDPLRPLQDTMLGSPAMREWASLAEAESESIEHEEVGR
jgi:glutathione S-transferase